MIYEEDVNKFPNKGEAEYQNVHLLSPGQDASTLIGVHFIELLVKGVVLELQTTNSVGKTPDCTPHTEAKALLLKIIPKQFIELAKIELVPT